MCESQLESTKKRRINRCHSLLTAHAFGSLVSAFQFWLSPSIWLSPCNAHSQGVTIGPINDMAGIWLQVKEAVDASPLSGADAKKRGLLDDSIYRFGLSWTYPPQLDVASYWMSHQAQAVPSRWSCRYAKICSCLQFPYRDLIWILEHQTIHPSSTWHKSVQTCQMNACMVSMRRCLFDRMDLCRRFWIICCLSGPCI